MSKASKLLNKIEDVEEAKKVPRTSKDPDTQKIIDDILKHSNEAKKVYAEWTKKTKSLGDRIRKVLYSKGIEDNGENGHVFFSLKHFTDPSYSHVMGFDPLSLADDKDVDRILQEVVHMMGSSALYQITGGGSIGHGGGAYVSNLLGAIEAKTVNIETLSLDQVSSLRNHENSKIGRSVRSLVKRAGKGAKFFLAQLYPASPPHLWSINVDTGEADHIWYEGGSRGGLTLYGGLMFTNAAAAKELLDILQKAAKSSKGGLSI